MIVSLLLQAIFITIVSFILSYVFGGLSVAVAIISVIFGSWVGRRYAKALMGVHPDWRLSAFQRGPAGLLELILSLFIFYAGIRHFLWLLFPHNGGLWTLLGNNLGDLPLHINFIRAFANGISFPPQNPIFASELLRYPYAIDLFNGIWEILGVPLSAHLFVVGVLGVLVSLILLRSFGGWWAIGAFFLNGGLNGWQVLRGIPVDDIHAGIEWKNLFITVFVPQRGMLFALPLGLILLQEVRAHMSGRAPWSAARRHGFGILWGFFPFIHLHSFVAVSIMMVGIAFIEKRMKGVKDLFLSKVFALAVVPATLFVLHSSDWFRAAGVMRWRWGWMARPGQTWSFLLQNFGPWLLLPLAIGITLFLVKGSGSKDERKKLWLEFGFNLFLFTLFFNLMLAPWEWDNIKVLIWPYLGLAHLAYVTMEPHIGPMVRYLQAFTFLFSGFVALIWSMPSPAAQPARLARLYMAGDLASTQGALARVNLATAVFAAVATHDHPLTYFGARRVMGYPGHIWSHGIRAGDTSAQLDKLLSGDSEWRKIVGELGVTHIFWGPLEQTRYGQTPKPWMTELKNVSRVPEFQIYQIETSMAQ